MIDVEGMRMGEHGGSLPPAGWLDDPKAPGYERWWDGSGWTEHRRVVGSGAASPSWATGSRPSPTGEVNVLAIASLVASLVWLGGFSSLAGIVLGVLARQQIDRSGGRERGEGLATAGIVIGILGMVLPILLLAGLWGSIVVGR